MTTLIEGIIIGLTIMFISFMGFMVSIILQLEKIRKEQEKITQYIPFDFLKQKKSSFKDGKQ